MGLVPPRPSLLAGSRTASRSPVTSLHSTARGGPRSSMESTLPRLERTRCDPVPSRNPVSGACHTDPTHSCQGAPAARRHCSAHSRDGETRRREPCSYVGGGRPRPNKAGCVWSHTVTSSRVVTAHREGSKLSLSRSRQGLFQALPAHGLCGDHSTLPLHLQSSHRQYISKQM